MFPSITIFFYIISVLVTMWGMIVVLSFLVSLLAMPVKSFWRAVTILK